MQQIKPMEPQRGQHGYWTHPDFPEPKDGNEFFVPGEFEAWQAEQGCQISVVMLDGDDGVGSEDAQKRYFEDGDTDILCWQPSKPEGEGWFIVSIHDHEDGPVCLWIRYPTEEQKSEVKEVATLIKRPDGGETLHFGPAPTGEQEQLGALKQDFLEKRQACEKAAYAYFTACPEGEERIFAGEVYQRIRLATSKSGKGR